MAKEDKKDETIEVNEEEEKVEETTEEKKEETTEQTTEEETSKKKTKFQNQAEQVIDDVISTFKEKGGELSKSINSYSASRARPLIDLIETEEKYILKAEINNVKKENIDLQATSKSIELKVGFDEDEELGEGRYIIKEITKGIVTRKIPLKNEIDIESISAKFDDSLLEVTIPKIKEPKHKVNIK